MDRLFWFGTLDRPSLARNVPLVPRGGLGRQGQPWIKNGGLAANFEINGFMSGAAALEKRSEFRSAVWGQVLQSHIHSSEDTARPLDGGFYRFGQWKQPKTAPTDQ